MSADDVRDLIIDRLMSGAYPIGSKLPTSRDLAEEIGAHRNTVAKAYNSLAEMGLVSVQQGRGTFVTALLDNRENKSSLVLQIEEQVQDVLRKARRLGIGENEIRELVERRISNLYAPNLPQVAFVECNHADITAAVSEIKAGTGLELIPLLLDDVRSAPELCTGRFQLIFTTLFHVKEVNRLIASTPAPVNVIGIYTQPDEEALRRITQIESESIVGIIASDVEGAQRFSGQVAAFTPATTKVYLSPSDEHLGRIDQEVDVIVCSRSQMARLRNMALNVPLIELPFHVTQQSMTHLVNRVTEHLGTVLT